MRATSFLLRAGGKRRRSFFVGSRFLNMQTRRTINTHLWIRDEIKTEEGRTPIIPEHARELLNEGYKITVEKSTQRCFKDEEYAAVGCNIAEHGTWRQAPRDTIILGVKELPNSNEPLAHRHVYFAHVYKYQQNWTQLLDRFDKGGGTILDLEFLVDDQGRRLCAFSRMAGVAGMGVGLLTWVRSKLYNIKPEEQQSIHPYPNRATLAKELAESINKLDFTPTVLIIGRLGRVGSGANDLAQEVIDAGTKLNIIGWDKEQTLDVSSFNKLLQYDLVFNCINLAGPITPFLTPQMLQQKPRRLSTVVDISCDLTSPFNPLPIYDVITTFKKPVVRALGTEQDEDPVGVISIDHLPTFLPRESSEGFSKDLLPLMKNIENETTDPVWARAREKFVQKVAEANNIKQ